LGPKPEHFAVLAELEAPGPRIPDPDVEPGKLRKLKQRVGPLEGLDRVAQRRIFADFNSDSEIRKFASDSRVGGSVSMEDGLHPHKSRSLHQVVAAP
jgi:hypothetical protein